MKERERGERVRKGLNITRAGRQKGYNPNTNSIISAIFGLIPPRRFGPGTKVTIAQ